MKRTILAAAIILLLSLGSTSCITTRPPHGPHPKHVRHKAPKKKKPKAPKPPKPERPPHEHWH